MPQKTTNSLRHELTRRATPIPQLTQVKVPLNPSSTNRSRSSAKSTLIKDIVPMKKDANSLMDLTNSAKTMNTTLSTRQRNVEVLKTITIAFTETAVISFMWLGLHKKKSILGFAMKKGMTWKWNWSEELVKKSQKYSSYSFELINDLYLVCSILNNHFEF